MGLERHVEDPAGLFSLQLGHGGSGRGSILSRKNGVRVDRFQTRPETGLDPVKICHAVLEPREFVAGAP
jgi:hypothetical protein